LSADPTALGIDLTDVAESGDGRGTCRGGVHSARNEVASPHLDVKRDLVIHLSVDVDTP